MTKEQNKEFYAPGEIVEGAHCLVCTRKYEFKRLEKDPITNLPMLKYELSRNSEVEVTKEMDYSEEELCTRNKLNVHYKLADKIKADAITVYIDSIKKVKFTVKEGFSHTLGASIYHTSERVVGVIKYPFDNLIKSLTSKSQNLIVLPDGQ